jgi:hypothetical protein
MFLVDEAIDGENSSASSFQVSVNDEDKKVKSTRWVLG